MLLYKVIVIIAFIVYQVNAKIELDLYPCLIDNKFGFVNQFDSIIINPIFDFALPFEGNSALVIIDGFVSYIDKKGNLIDTTTKYYEGMIVWSKCNGQPLDNLQDFVQKFTGQEIEIIESMQSNPNDLKWPFGGFFNEINEFYAVVYADRERYGILDLKNDTIIRYYRCIDIFYEVCDWKCKAIDSNVEFPIAVVDNFGNYYVDSNFLKISEIDMRYEVVRSFRKGYSIVGNKDSSNIMKFGVINKFGDIIVPLIYDYIKVPVNGFTTFSKNGKNGIMDSTYKELFYGDYLDDGVYNPFFESFKDNKCIYSANTFKEGKDGERMKGICDVNGKILIECKYEQITHFYNGLAIVQKDGIIYYINENGKEFIFTK